MRPVLHIARQELRRYRPMVSRRLLVAALIAGLLVAAVWPIVARDPVTPEAGLYVVEAHPETPLHPILRSDVAFDVRHGDGSLFAAGRADLWAGPDRVRHDAASDRSRAAARHLELAAQAWLDRALEDEEDPSAAFPVRVHLVFVARDASRAETAPPPRAPEDEAPSAPRPDLLDEEGQQSLDLLPGQVEPPFPMRSLLLTFAYLVPMNLLGQLYSGAIYSDRIRGRGLSLLAAPVHGGQILAGRSLPYAGAALALGLLVTLVIGAGPVGLLAMLPVLAFVLASSLLFALLAATPRALTFLLVATTVLLSTFLFLPAIFIDLHPIAFLSPVTVVAADLRGETVAWGAFAYATLPMALASLALAMLSVPLYREEALFAPRALTAKLVDAVAGLVRTPGRLVPAGALTVPFALALELFVVLFAIALEVRVAFLAFLLGAAAVEEGLKALVAYAHLRRPVARRAAPWVVGLLVGTGFFLGEKLALLLGLVGFGLLDLGPEVMATFGVAPSVLLVLAPLALHIVASVVAAHLAARGAPWAAAGWLLATLLHAAYNAAVVRLVAGGLP